MESKIETNLLAQIVIKGNQTDHHDITEILLKVALNTITHP
jgi:hypothetical protein